MIGDANYRNRGYGSEVTRLVLRYAFEWLNLNRVILSVYVHNRWAVCVYQKEGFRQEGCLRQVRYHGGWFQDEHIYGILREEWDASSEKGNDVA